MKKVLVALGLIPIVTAFLGLIRYSSDLNRFIARDSMVAPAIKGHSSVNKTKVYIVGTMHKETNHFKRQHLYQYLDSIAPSVILYEGTSKKVKRIANKTDYLAQIIDGLRNQDRVEKPVVLKFLERNPRCILLPYEWEQRDRYRHKHRLGKRSGQMINTLIRMYSEDVLTNEQARTVKQFLELNSTLMELDKEATITDINSITMDSILMHRQHYVYKKLPQIILDRNEPLEYLDFISIHMAYWDLRNKAMAQNILKQIELNPNKVFAVLNGFYHRYYLISELKKYEDSHHFTVVEL